MRSIAAAASAAVLIGLTACNPASEPPDGGSTATESTAGTPTAGEPTAEGSPPADQQAPPEGSSTPQPTKDESASQDPPKTDRSNPADGPTSGTPSSPGRDGTAGGQQGGKNTGTGPNRHDNAPSLCDAADMKGAIQQIRGGGAAGSVYRGLVLTNTSEEGCVLKGYPGVSFVTAAGAQIGAAADRDLSTTSPALSLKPGESAMATLQVIRAENYGSACNLTEAAGLRVYPPSAYDSLIVEQEMSACASPGVALLTIGAFQPVK